MNDILLVLDMQRQQAEANLVALTHKRDAYAVQIFEINKNIATVSLASDNLFMREKWRRNQIVRIKLIEKKMQALEQDIFTSTKIYKTVIAKNVAAKDTIENHLRKQALSAEEQETSANLDTYLLTRSP
ncbi:MAG: hypothetical protein L3J65_04270 [Robiginitomaculum sp.]|nr:hypothetical protein [Robiginitomaculum sp.]